jgi:hypothetical protein
MGYVLKARRNPALICGGMAASPLTPALLVHLTWNLRIPKFQKHLAPILALAKTPTHLRILCTVVRIGELRMGKWRIHQTDWGRYGRYNIY